MQRSQFSFSETVYDLVTLAFFGIWKNQKPSYLIPKSSLTLKKKLYFYRTSTRKSYFSKRWEDKFVLAMTDLHWEC